MPRIRSRQPNVMLWRDSQQLRGVRSQLVAALNGCDNGAIREVDIKTVRNAIEVCDQAIKTEVGHEPTASELKEVKHHALD